MRPLALILAGLLLATVVGVGEAISGPDYNRLAELQRTEGNFSEHITDGYADILNASEDMAPKISGEGKALAKMAWEKEQEKFSMKWDENDGNYYTPISSIGPVDFTYTAYVSGKGQLVTNVPKSVSDAKTEYDRLGGDGSESIKYEIPMGPYKTSFELRSLLDHFGMDYFLHNESVGVGKEYHTAEYEVYELQSDNIWITIVRSIGPATYHEPTQLVEPLLEAPHKWEIEAVKNIVVDGKTGQRIVYANPSQTRYKYSYVFHPDSKTAAVAMLMDKDWARDVSLFEETVHITGPT